MKVSQAKVLVWAALTGGAVLLAPEVAGDALFLAATAAFAWIVSTPIVTILRPFLVSKHLLFDIHGVYVNGDMQVEDLYEVPGTKELVGNLRKKNPVAALTNFNPELYHFYNGKWGFDKLFGKVYYSGKYGVRKPSPEIFKIVLDDLQAKPNEVVFLDDVQENVDAAKRLGITAIRYETPQQAAAELQKLGIKGAVA